MSWFFFSTFQEKGEVFFLFFFFFLRSFSYLKGIKSILSLKWNPLSHDKLISFLLNLFRGGGVENNVYSGYRCGLPGYVVSAYRIISCMISIF